jgi:hypothetical protein
VPVSIRSLPSLRLPCHSPRPMLAIEGSP